MDRVGLEPTRGLFMALLVICWPNHTSTPLSNDFFTDFPPKWLPSASTIPPSVHCTRSWARTNRLGFWRPALYQMSYPCKCPRPAAWGRDFPSYLTYLSWSTKNDRAGILTRVKVLRRLSSARFGCLSSFPFEHHMSPSKTADSSY